MPKWWENLTSFSQGVHITRRNPLAADSLASERMRSFSIENKGVTLSRASSLAKFNVRRAKIPIPASSAQNHDS